MSLLKKYLKGWRFRTNQPSFEPGEELQLFVTDIKDENVNEDGDVDGTLIARVGDSFIHISDGSAALVGSRVRVRIERFDADSHTGHARLLEPVDTDD